MHNQILFVFIYIYVRTNDDAIQLNVKGKKCICCWGEPATSQRGKCQNDQISPINNELLKGEYLDNNLGSKKPLQPISSSPPPKIINGVIQVKKNNG